MSRKFNFGWEYKWFQLLGHWGYGDEIPWQDLWFSVYGIVSCMCTFWIACNKKYSDISRSTEIESLQTM